MKNENVAPKPLQIKQDDKFFSRIMSKETEPSFRVLYYDGTAGAIPFTWESCPGTPKNHHFSDNYIAPLTPPPSYQLGRSRSKITRRINSSGKLSFFRALRSFNKPDDGKPASMSSSSYPSSSNASWSPTPTKKQHSGGRKGNNWMLRSISGAVGFGDCRREDGDDSPTSTLCFGGAGAGNVIRRVFFSVGRHGLAE